MPYYFALAPNYDFTFHPQVLVQLRHPLAGRLAASPGQRPIHRVDRRHRPGPRRDRGGQCPGTRLARLGPDQGAILDLVLVALRMGRHGRQRRELPPLLPARSDPADRPCQHRLSAGHERSQLLRRQALPVRRPAAHRHALLQCLGASGHRLQLHPRRAGARRRAELHRACPRDDAQRQHRHQPRGRGSQLAAQDDRSDRPGVDPLRARARRCLQLLGRARSRDAGAAAERHRAARRRRRRRALLLSVRRPHGLCARTCSRRRRRSSCARTRPTSGACRTRTPRA